MDGAAFFTRQHRRRADSKLARLILFLLTINIYMLAVVVLHFYSDEAMRLAIIYFFIIIIRLL